MTLRRAGASRIALTLASSANTLRSLELVSFDFGVFIMPPHPVPSGQTYVGNTVDGLVMRDIRVQGVVLDSTGAGICVEPCRAENTWVDTTVTGNVIEARLAGIMFGLGSSRARIEGATVAGNTIRVTGTANGPGIGLTTGLDSMGARIADVLVARNSIEGSPDIGIMVAPGTTRAQASVLERVRVLDNRVHLVRRGPYFCCQGVVVQAGSDAPGPAKGPPLRYLDDSRARDVLVRGNAISGTLQWGIQLIAGFGGGGRRNRVEQVRVERNVVRSSTLGTGVYLVTGAGTPYKNRLATGNRIARVTIDANRIAIGRSPVGGTPAIPGGIALQGGGDHGRGNAIADVRIRGNRIATSHVGVAIVGGIGPTARGNSVSCVRISGTRVIGTRTEVSVVANQRGARGNRATLGGC